MVVGTLPAWTGMRAADSRLPSSTARLSGTCRALWPPAPAAAGMPKLPFADLARLKRAGAPASSEGGDSGKSTALRGPVWGLSPLGRAPQVGGGSPSALAPAAGLLEKRPPGPGEANPGDLADWQRPAEAFILSGDPMDLARWCVAPRDLVRL